jgi:hypothetical protein
MYYAGRLVVPNESANEFLLIYAWPVAVFHPAVLEYGGGTVCGKTWFGRAIPTKQYAEFISLAPVEFRYVTCP